MTIAISVVLGMVMAVMEGWAYSNGFFYMIGNALLTPTPTAATHY